MTELLGTSVLWIMITLGVIGLVALPTLRAVPMLVSGVRLAVRMFDARAGTRSLAAVPERPLELIGLSPGLADLARQTRQLAHELHRHHKLAATWPSAGAAEGPSFWSSFVGVDKFGAQIEATREIWEWLRSVERLSPGEREQLAGLGVEADAVRELLLNEQAPLDQMRALAGLLWSIDGRLTGGLSGYRGSNARGVGPGGTVRSTPGGVEEEDERGDELRERRRRWAELIEHHSAGISRMAGRYTRGRCEREDLEQDISLAPWQALPGFRGESSLKTFVLRVARYCCYRYLRRRGRAQVDPLVGELDDPSACIESWLSEIDDRARLERALARLPESLESTLVLRLEGKTCAEIAAALGISEQNVSVRLNRARQRLVRQLAAA
ncbi:RNA polymerase sigma factor, sigma-70 family [Nannocystis exedens]|uniref:RNA polymerase sigma factor, sigma-70 family n=1 Tax=Nannocystis exedens TaxID=54 RepID=A0A1I2HQR1_9BACT|nr:sigma-70 family RNA polymerase sigma factor [Nannocystis exedens]PCC69434.1 ECF RNA polymerase sigma factor SigE [Nannocystis exedens]SFF31868.1 RNA polymerase sigma factor, sigma-70 family [Nannocystis exedens]